MNVSEIIFEPLDEFPKSDVQLPVSLSDERAYIMKQFLQSGYFVERNLYIDRFLDQDNTIDLEKLELAISLIVEYLEFSVKFKKPIYVFLRNMRGYLARRGIPHENIERITEESSFILGFCQSIFDEESNREFIVRFSALESR